MATRVAIIQAGSVWVRSAKAGAEAAEALFDTPATLQAALHWIGEAARQGAQLVVFPEAFLGGYPKGMDFGARVGSRSPEGRREFRRYFASAIDETGPEATSIGEAAREAKVYIAMGCVERDGATLYCSVLFFGPDGTLLGKHRKLMPTAMERLIWGFGDGSTLPVLDTPLGRVGAVICWENYMPLLRAAMYNKGIQLYCACTVDDRDSWVPTMRHIAIEGRCFVLSACQFVEGQIRGGSLIVNPFGDVVAGPLYGEEALLIADLELGEIAEGKFDLDVAGHYARPDVFTLVVDETGKAGMLAAPPDPALESTCGGPQKENARR